MWIYRSPVGILKIVRQPDGTFGLCHNETVWEACDTPQAEADNVFSHVTGCDEWDSCPDAGPSDLSECPLSYLFILGVTLRPGVPCQHSARRIITVVCLHPALLTLVSTRFRV